LLMYNQKDAEKTNCIVVMYAQDDENRMFYYTVSCYLTTVISMAIALLGALGGAALGGLGGYWLGGLTGAALGGIAGAAVGGLAGAAAYPCYYPYWGPYYSPYYYGYGYQPLYPAMMPRPYFQYPMQWFPAPMFGYW